MNIALSITDITSLNKHEKLITTAYALSERMGLNADIEVPWLEKAKTHKYISRKLVNDHWEYEYPKSKTKHRIHIANQTELITGIKPLPVDSSNVVIESHKFFYEFKEKVKKGMYCRALQNRKIVGVNEGHFFPSAREING